jgi:hypothetical protein
MLIINNFFYIHHHIHDNVLGYRQKYLVINVYIMIAEQVKRFTVENSKLIERC